MAAQARPKKKGPAPLALTPHPVLVLPDPPAEAAPLNAHTLNFYIGNVVNEQVPIDARRAAMSSVGGAGKTGGAGGGGGHEPGGGGWPRPGVLIVLAFFGIAVVALGVFALIQSRSSTMALQCSPGLVPKDGQCVAGDKPGDEFARCIVQDLKTQSKGTNETSVSAAVKAATDTSSTAAEAKQNFERSIEKNPDRCFLMDVSNKCFVLAGGQAITPLPASCSAPDLQIPSAIVPILPSASAATSTQKPRPVRLVPPKQHVFHDCIGECQYMKSDLYRTCMTRCETLNAQP